MNDNELPLHQIQTFVTGNRSVGFKPIHQTESYQWIAKTLKRFDYFKLSEGEKNSVRAYIKKVTGYSRPQLNRLIAQYRNHRWIGERRKPRHAFASRYS